MAMTEDMDGLEAELNAALDASNQPPKPDNLVETPEGETAEQKDERLYKREGRRFVAKEDEKPPAEAKDAKAEPGKESAAATTWKPLWYKDEYGPWEKLSPDLRQKIQDRETESAQAVTKYSTAAKAWEPVNELLKPHLQELQAAGVQPQQYVANLINADKFLRGDPVQGINWLVQQYLGAGWDIPALADWMYQQGVEAKKVDPVQQKLTALEQELHSLKAAPQQQYRANTERIVSEWSKDKPHWSDLQATVYGLIQADPSVRDRFQANPQATLDQLYEQAQWAHPQLRERILADQRAAEVSRARAAGATSPRGGAQINGAARSKPTMSLEEEVAARFDGLM